MEERTSEAQIHVLVQGTTRELCRVQLPLTALPNLQHMIPDVDRARIEATGVDFADVVRRALAGDCRPQVLIEASAQDRSYRIWIE